MGKYPSVAQESFPLIPNNSASAQWILVIILPLYVVYRMEVARRKLNAVFNHSLNCNSFLLIQAQSTRVDPPGLRCSIDKKTIDQSSPSIKNSPDWISYDCYRTVRASALTRHGAEYSGRLWLFRVVSLPIWTCLRDGSIWVPGKMVCLELINLGRLYRQDEDHLFGSGNRERDDSIGIVDPRCHYGINTGKSFVIAGRYAAEYECHYRLSFLLPFSQLFVDRSPSEKETAFITLSKPTFSLFNPRNSPSIPS